MKKLFICSGLGMMFFMLAGCTTNYVMTTKNGQTIVTQGKPQLDKETGMTSYTDQEGNQREINSNDVAQLIKADAMRCWRQRALNPAGLGLPGKGNVMSLLLLSIRHSLSNPPSLAQCDGSPPRDVARQTSRRPAE